MMMIGFPNVYMYMMSPINHVISVARLRSWDERTMNTPPVCISSPRMTDG